MNPELEALTATLDGLRSGVLKKLAGLSEADARRSTVGSGTNLAGLLQHLTFVESHWFDDAAARGKRSMQVDPGTSLRTLRADYKAACARSDEIVAELDDPDAAVKNHTLRLALLGVINETARHAGHADIIREQIDGTTGR